MEIMDQDMSGDYGSGYGSGYMSGDYGNGTWLVFMDLWTDYLENYLG